MLKLDERTVAKILLGGWRKIDQRAMQPTIPDSQGHVHKSVGVRIYFYVVLGIVTMQFKCIPPLSPCR